MSVIEHSASVTLTVALILFGFVSAWALGVAQAHLPTLDSMTIPHSLAWGLIVGWRTLTHFAEATR
jgi:hypothetical protein